MIKEEEYGGFTITCDKCKEEELFSGAGGKNGAIRIAMSYMWLILSDKQLCPDCNRESIYLPGTQTDGGPVDIEFNVTNLESKSK